MLKLLVATATVMLITLATPVSAKRYTDYCYRNCQSSGHHVRHARYHVRHAKRHKGKRHKKRYTPVRDYGSVVVRRAYSDRVAVLPHPPGCPQTAFCGCGTALHIFGKPLRDLWLAANWLRFPLAKPGPGMVAVRQHHVFAILRVISPGVVLAYDPNSGGHQTRIHARSLAGYSVRNPNTKVSLL
jgi:hypothetical protein